MKNRFCLFCGTLLPEDGICLRCGAKYELAEDGQLKVIPRRIKKVSAKSVQRKKFSITKESSPSEAETQTIPIPEDIYSFSDGQKLAEKHMDWTVEKGVNTHNPNKYYKPVYSSQNDFHSQPYYYSESEDDIGFVNNNNPTNPSNTATSRSKSRHALKHIFRAILFFLLFFTLFVNFLYPRIRGDLNIDNRGNPIESVSTERSTSITSMPDTESSTSSKTSTNSLNESSRWREAYTRYIQDMLRNGTSYGYTSFNDFKFAFVFITDDDIPELYISSGRAYENYICYFDGEDVVNQETNFSYFMERGNLLIDDGGEMDSYHTYAYSLENDSWNNVFRGEYQYGGNDSRKYINFTVGNNNVTCNLYNEMVMDLIDAYGGESILRTPLYEDFLSLGTCLDALTSGDIPINKGEKAEKQQLAVHESW